MAELEELILLLSWLIELLTLVRSLFRLALLAAGVTVTVGELDEGTVVGVGVVVGDAVAAEPVTLGLFRSWTRQPTNPMTAMITTTSNKINKV